MVPMIMTGPGIRPGTVETPVSLIDLYPTILEAAGVAVAPDDSPRPGRSWLALARRPDDDQRVAFAEYHAMGATSAAYLVRRGRYKLLHYVGFEPELYDLEADPEETRDVAGDPAAAGARAELERLLREIVDPEEVDRRAKADQAALVERFGGPEVAVELGTVAETPVPEEVTEAFQ